MHWWLQRTVNDKWRITETLESALQICHWVCQFVVWYTSTVSFIRYRSMWQKPMQTYGNMSSDIIQLLPMFEFTWDDNFPLNIYYLKECNSSNFQYQYFAEKYFCFVLFCLICWGFFWGGRGGGVASYWPEVLWSWYCCT